MFNASSMGMAALSILYFCNIRSAVSISALKTAYGSELKTWVLLILPESFACCSKVASKVDFNMFKRFIVRGFLVLLCLPPGDSI